MSTAGGIEDVPLGTCLDCKGETYVTRADGTRWVMTTARRCAACAAKLVKPLPEPKQRNVEHVTPHQRLEREALVLDRLRTEPATVLELATQFGYNTATIGGYLQRLKYRGLVENGPPRERGGGASGRDASVWQATQ